MQEAQNPFEENPKVLDWEQTVYKALCSENTISNMKIVPRTPLIGDWLKAGDLGFIFAARGIGKSWLAMHLAKGLANQSDVGPWKSHARVRVLYLDGEMAIEDVQLRIRALGELNDNICYLNHYVLFGFGHTMNLADFSFQHAILNCCLKKHFDVLICDNLSTLSSGIDENKSLDWELIQNWLLELRRNNITVIIVHHAGRNNQMRGTSKREDPAFWIIRLDEDDLDDSLEPSGARFISRFTKWRNASAVPHTYRWHFKPIGYDVDIRVREASPLFVFLNWVESGLTSCNDISSEMGVSKGHVSRLAKQAVNMGKIIIKNRQYFLAD